ncbi:ferroxidase fet3 [Coemansia thaxteri]|uniref:Ferroxidase fet3 n=1 Tax=Coemansia thaxteri TaxID=2663907 RepID=A0A9W8EG58_9FUNG|nr:ferroxidase fet3 [Coemansia thaxteri]KAJ2005153.1 ferroxidase fet3 [Coemansia thaxteri]KAJ2472580.1 ferroxidase fet3 [Coemansia sp. RSA 2322]KAJ2481522.1 ferroxidase fet3 [Coemansia sp. RSA 2320]
MRALHILLWLAALAHARHVVQNWDVTYVTTNRGLLQSPKRGIGVNGKLPLPVVEAELGDTLVLNVRNSLDVPTSLHSHGIFQRGSNYYDGVGMVTECSIAPGTNFTYHIELQQTGTYFIHGHTHEQNFDGLHTPLIIRDPHDPTPVTKEILFAAEDWWPITLEEMMSAFVRPHGPVDLFAYPPSTLINGANGTQARPLYFEPGKTYKIRLLSMMSLPVWEFVIDDHELLVVEVDGIATKPKPVSVVRLGPGQRVSVLVTGKPATNMNYQYHMTTFGDFLPKIPNVYPQVFSSAVIYSPSAPLFAPSTTPSEPFDDISLESLEYLPAMRPDRSLFLNSTYGFTADDVPYESFNLIPFRSPKVPTMLSALTTGDMSLNPITYGPQTTAQVLKYGEVVELLIWSKTRIFHSHHLHGHAFQVVERGFINDTIGEFRRRVPTSGVSPLMRDTLMVYIGEYAVVRFRADNPGSWLFHCHLGVHMAQGMALVFVSAPQQMRETLVVPQSVLDQCSVQGIPVSGNVVGNMAYNFDGAANLPSLILSREL